MGLGTKNRQKQTADLCKQHLRQRYLDKLGLVEEFILEMRGLLKALTSVVGASSRISKTSKKRCSSASRFNSRIGSTHEPAAIPASAMSSIDFGDEATANLE
jgi:hypothetical protein